jgi:hypothetical protein
MFKVTEALRITVPFCPVIVNPKFPSVAPVFVVTVMVEEPPVVLAGLNVALVPLGSPNAPNVTAPPNPPVRLIRIVNVAVPPATTACEGGLAIREKSPAAADCEIVAVAEVLEVLPNIVIVPDLVAKFGFASTVKDALPEPRPTNVPRWRKEVFVVGCQLQSLCISTPRTPLPPAAVKVWF